MFLVCRVAGIVEGCPCLNTMYLYQLREKLNVINNFHFCKKEAKFSSFEPIAGLPPRSGPLSSPIF